MALTRDGQIQWRDLVIGTGTPLPLAAADSITGWLDLPAQRGGSTPLAGRHGSYAGQRLSGNRLVTVALKSDGRYPPEAFAAALAELRRATAPAENPVEEPLVIRLDGQSLMCQAICLRRSPRVDRLYRLGRSAIAVQWEATDPRLYAVDEQAVEVELATTAAGGLDFSGGGLDFTGGLDFGTGQQGGARTVTVGGHVPTWPVLEISGPVTGPVVTLGESGRRLGFDGAWSVLAGQTLLIDTYRRTAEIAGVSVRQRLSIAQWSPLEPGSTVVRFSAAAYSADTRLRVRFRDAYH